MLGYRPLPPVVPGPNKRPHRPPQFRVPAPVLKPAPRTHVTEPVPGAAPAGRVVTVGVTPSAHWHLHLGTGRTAQHRAAEHSRPAQAPEWGWGLRCVGEAPKHSYTSGTHTGPSNWLLRAAPAPSHLHMVFSHLHGAADEAAAGPVTLDGSQDRKPCYPCSVQLVRTHRGCSPAT